MRVASIRTLRGPNVWADCPLIEAVVDLRPLRQALTKRCLQRLARRVEQSLHRIAPPAPIEQTECCFLGPPSPPARKPEVQLARLIAAATRHLICAAGGNIHFVAVAAAPPGRSRVLVECCDADQVVATLRDVVALCDRLLADALRHAGESATALVLPLPFAEDPNTLAIVAAASARGIPVLRLGELGYVQLGQGVRQRRICGAETDRTSALAAELAQNKQITKQLLGRWGLPTPQGRLVATAADAWAAACGLGLPVAIKPLAADYGNGVSLNLSTREQVVAASQLALAEGEQILVERYVAGGDHRLLVVGGRVVAAARRDPPIVGGDGRSTIAQLVAQENRSPLRGGDPAAPLAAIRLDERADAWLATLGLTRSTVPSRGQQVQVRGNSHLKTGGSNHDVTDRVHTDVARCAVQAVRLLGLDIAGVDVVAEDIARPLEVQGGAIIEVNAGPGMVQHLWPLTSTPSPVGEAIVDTLFSPGDDGRIPVAAIYRGDRSAELTRQVARLAAACGRSVGYASSGGLRFNHWQASAADHANARGAEAVLMHPEVDLAVLEVSPASVRHHGLAFDACQVAAFCDSSAAPWQDGTRAAEVLLECVAKNGFLVLPATGCGARHRPATRFAGTIVYFAMDRENAQVRRHLLAGGRAVIREREWLLLATGNHVVRIFAPFASDPLLAPRSGAEESLLVAAVAVIWSLGIPVQQLREALASIPAASAFDGNRLVDHGVKGRLAARPMHSHAVDDANASLRRRRRLPSG